MAVERKFAVVARRPGPLHDLERGVMIATMRDLTEILYDVDQQLRALRHSADGVSREDPVAAMRQLGQLADELEQFGLVANFRTPPPCR